MSSASPYESDSVVRSRDSVDSADLRALCLPTVRRVGFWAAVLIPFVLLSLLASGVIVELPFVAGGLLAVNLAGLLLGQEHNR